MTVSPAKAPERIAQRLYLDLDRLATLAAATYPPTVAPDTPVPAALLASLREHIRVLADALLMHSPALFEGHLLQQREQDASPARDRELYRELAAVRQTLLFQLPVRDYEVANAPLAGALNQLRAELPFVSLASDLPPLTELATSYLELLLRAGRRDAVGLILDTVRQGADVTDLYLQVLQPVLREVGERWHRGELSVATEHYCTFTTELALAQLYPYLWQEPRNGRRLVAGSVAGDLHVVGLRMVADFLEADGWDVYYLGGNVPTDSLVSLVRDQQADLLLLGASMPHHVSIIQHVIGALRRATGTEGVRVLVGGRPFNDDSALWQRVGADGCAADARHAVAEARALFAPVA